MLWVSLEDPRRGRGASNEYPQHMFYGEIKKTVSLNYLFLRKTYVVGTH